MIDPAAGAVAVPPDEAFQPATFDPVAALRHHATSRPNAPAVSEGGVVVSYAGLYDRVLRVANGLQALGVQPGDRVCYIGRNWPELFEIAFGCARIGAVLAPLNWRLTPADLTDLVADAVAAVVVSDIEFAGSVPPVPSHLVVGDNYERWRDGAPSQEPEHTSAPDDAFFQFYTSGTTGLPKGVVIRNRNIGHLFRAAPRWTVDSDSTIAVVMPLFHMGGSAWAFVGLFAGAHCVVFPEFSPEGLLEALEEDGITAILVAPVMLQMMLTVPGVADRDYARLRAIAYGAAPVTSSTLRGARDTFGAPLLQLFGLTETCGAIIQLDPEDHREELLTSIGRPYPWVDVEVRDPVTEEKIEPGAFGELWVRSEQCADRYWGRPEETAQLRPADGTWLRTGDGGYVDEQGFVFITDRIKDMIVTGGENIYPAEVERVLSEHPEVADVAVIGVPDDTWGEAVTAVVVRASDAKLDEAALIEWARPRLAGFRRPRRVEFVGGLPRNPSGKILRRKIRDPYWEHRSRQV